MTQVQALEIMKTGSNVFLTGPAGSGKTHVLRLYIEELRRRGIPIGITASTGIAATHMGGVTIHSWCGIGIKDNLSDQDVEEIGTKDYVRKKVENVRVLIIDEISMLHDFRLDSVDRVLRHIRKCDEPFGGLQVILCGDFFQLPPINRSRENSYNELFDEEVRTNFAYHSPSWRSLGLTICYLEEQHRQSDDEYTRILNEIRDNNVSENTWKILTSRINAEPEVDISVEPTRLYSHNANVDVENEKELAKIPGQVFSYEMNGRGNRKLVEVLKKSCLAPEKLYLKENARVMFVKNNYEDGYVNGTLGTVIECSYSRIVVRTSHGKDIEVKPMQWSVEEDSRTLAELSQYPLRLAWAITIHKSQGMSLDAATVDLSQSFEKGMGYVALSRIRSLKGLSLIGLNKRALEIHDEALEHDIAFREMSREQGERFARIPPEEIKKMHLAFLGPEPTGKEIRKKKIKLPREKKIRSEEVTKKLISEGKTIRQVADEREMVFGTILNHIETLRAGDPFWNISHLKSSVPVVKFQRIAQAFHKVGMQQGGERPLSPVMSVLKSSGSGSYSFEELRVVRLFL